MISIYFNDVELDGIIIIRSTFDSQYHTAPVETEISVEGRFERNDKVKTKIESENVTSKATVEKGLVYFDDDVDIKLTDELKINDIRYKVIEIENMNDFSLNYKKVTLQ